MRRDLDRAMERRGLEAVIVCGSPDLSWEAAYLVGSLKVTEGYVFKRHGDEPVFICLSVERREAAKGRVSTCTFAKVGLTPIRRSGLSKPEREAAVIERILDHFNVAGRVAIHGTGPISTYSEALRILRERRGDQIVTDSGGRNLFEEARITKDPDEIRQIENVALRVQDVYRNTINYLTTLISEGGKVFDIEGEPILVGDIKEMVVREAARRRLDVPVDVIFSQGVLSAIPHNRGESNEILRTGVPVVFDLLARERGLGYCYEITRTFSIGSPNARVEEIYSLVSEARTIAFEELKPGRTGQEVDLRVSEFFESHGFATLRGEPNAERGYVHYLGHGIGLEIYEDPYMGPVEGPLELTAGMVLTVEPGLYVPEEGIGVRIGDVVVIERDGSVRRLDNISCEPLVPLSR